MKSWPSKALLLGGAAALLVAIPALGQEREAPESLLPPGFGDPETLPPPAKEEPAPTPRLPSSPTPSPSTSPIGASPIDSAEEDLEEAERPVPAANYFVIPPGSERPTDVVGVLQPGSFGLAPDSFGRTNGAFLATLMRRLDAPLPSRWTSILLRRALLSRLNAASAVDPVDWVAERAALLLRMGEADAARMLVQSVDIDNYTPRMIEVAGQTALATADPAALCPLVGPARRLSDDPVWALSEAMCVGLEGEAARASALVDQARRRHGSGIDLLLAEKVVGAGAETRRAVTIEWEGVDEINPWRFGLASATGLEIPERLMNGAEPRIHAWLARAPMLPLDRRLGAASIAASLGVFSSESLVEIYSLVFDATDPADQAGTVGARLRTAWTHRSLGERMEALRGLWTEFEAPHERHARLILTAGAAARIPPSAELGDDAANLIASMLSAGMDREAARWAPIVQEGGAGERAWALLAVAAPRPAVETDSGRIGSFLGADDSAGRRRSQLLIAALAGLERIPAQDASQLAGSAGFRIGRDDPWTRAIDRAALERQPGTVALLAGVGMQTGGWSGVPPHYLFRMVRALRTVGLEYEARMIAAEALARL